jgi:hypothetical protein
VDAFDAWLAVLDKALAGTAPDQATWDSTYTVYEGAMEDWLIALFPAFPWSLD